MKKMSEHQAHHRESVFGYIKETKHQDFSDFALAFPKAMYAAKQRGPLEPIIAHEVMDELICNLIQKYVTVPVEHEPSSLDIKEHVVFEEEAFEHLYVQLPKL